MTNATGSKSARTPKPTKPPAQGGAPEVTLQNGTTLVLPNPADAPAPPKGKGKKKPAPSVATREAATPPAEVPDWAKRAEAEGSMADSMAAVPEVAPTTEPTPETSVPKARRVPKAANPKAKAPITPAKAGSLRAVGNAWIDAIKARGATTSTFSSYANDLEVAYGFLDGNTPATDLTEKQIATFDKCKAVLTKKNGKPKAMPTILKTRRALRLALTWAAETKLIKRAPYPAA